MRAYAFLGPTATDLVSGVRWPVPGGARPGPWVESSGGSPLRGAAPDRLLWWLDEELWEVELAGEVRERGRGLLAERGRLLAPVDAWTPDVARDLIWDCALRLRDAAVDALRSGGREGDAAALATADDLDSITEAADRAAAREGHGALLAGFTADLVRFSSFQPNPARGAAVAARIAAHALAGGDEHAPRYDAAYAAERRRQADWLRARLGL